MTRVSRTILVVFGQLAGCAASRTVEAQLPAPRTAAIALTRIVGSIEVDGVDRDSAWIPVPAFPLVMHRPFAGQAAAYPSTVKVAYDDRYVYVFAALGSKDRQTVSGYSLRRDQIGNDDVFRILLDTFDDRESAVVFATTPTGVRIDFVVSRDGVISNLDWNGRWDVATTTTNNGWRAELRIPLSTLRFRADSKGGVTMGMTVARYSAADNEIDSYPVLGAQFTLAAARPSLSQHVRLEGIHPAPELAVVPYAAAAVDHSAVRGAGEVAGGVDVKLGVGSATTIDLTIHPDFGEAEADELRPNLTRFPLFLSEKRAFFQERAGLFEMQTGFGDDRSRIFHSRRIGLTQSGEPIRIDGGIRGVTRLRSWDAGVMYLHAASDSGNSHGDDFLVARARRSIGDAGANVGGILTVVNNDGGQNAVAAADLHLRVSSNDFITAQLAQSIDARPGAGQSAMLGRLSWERRAASGFAYEANLKSSGSAYLPGIGFEPRSGTTHASGALQYTWISDQARWWHEIKTGLEMSSYLANDTRTVGSGSYNGYALVTLPHGSSLLIEAERSEELLPDTLQLNRSTAIVPGRYRDLRLISRYEPTPARRIRAAFWTSAGTLYDGTQVVVGISPSATLSRHLQLGVDAEWNTTRLAASQRILRSDVLRIRADAAINTRLSAGLNAQYLAINRTTYMNGHFRLNLAEGRDLFLVYRETRVRGDAIPAPRQRRLLVKMAYRLDPH